MRRLGLALASVSFLCAAGALLFEALSWSAVIPETWGIRGYATVVGVAYTAVGVVVALRRRSNPVGWLILLAGLLYCVTELCYDYAIFAVVGRTVPLAAGTFSAWLGSWIWTCQIGFITPAVFLLYPDGRMPFRRIAPLIWATLATGTALLATYMALRPGPLQLATYLDNPFPLLPADVAPGVGALSIAVGFPTLLVIATAVISRFRRAGGVQRLQLKWLAAAVVPYLVMGLLSSVLPDKIWQVAFIVMQVVVPVAIGVAILRYRLYEIDVLVNRALVYGALSTALVATYAAFVVMLQGVLRPVTQGSELSVALSTLATVALAQPLRRRIQNAVDLRFYRQRYDADRVLDSFTSRLRDEVDLEVLHADLIDAVWQTVQPTHASVWLKRAR